MGFAAILSNKERKKKNFVELWSDALDFWQNVFNKVMLMTDCAIIGNYSTENFAVAVEILNTVIHTCSIHQNVCKTLHLQGKTWCGAHWGTEYMKLSFRLVKLVLSCSLQYGPELGAISQDNSLYCVIFELTHAYYILGSYTSLLVSPPVTSPKFRPKVGAMLM